MKIIVISLLLIGVIYSCLEFNTSEDMTANLTTTLEPTNCITFTNNNHTVSINFIQYNQTMYLNNSNEFYIDNQRNLVVTVNKTAFDRTYYTNDTVVFNYDSTTTNPITGTKYYCNLPYQQISTTEQNLTIRNISIQFIYNIPSTYCFRNISVSNVPSFYDSSSNISVDCRRNINMTYGQDNLSIFYDNISNTYITPFNYKRNIKWDLTMGNFAKDDICNITGYAPTWDSIKTNTQSTLVLGQSATDTISGNVYNAPTESSCPFQLINLNVNQTAPYQYRDVYRNISIEIFVPGFDELSLNRNGTCVSYKMVCEDYFVAECKQEEKDSGDLEGCVRRIASPEEWTVKLNDSILATEECRKDLDDKTKEADSCHGVLDSGTAFFGQFYNWVIVGAIGLLVASMVVGGIVLYRKYVQSTPKQIPPPTIRSPQKVSINDILEKTIDNPKIEINKQVVPKGYSEKDFEVI